MKIIISDYLRDHIRRNLGDESPEERCGLLFGSREEDLTMVTDWVECPNASDEPLHEYDIDREDALAAAHGHGYEEKDIVGSVHTHPHGEGADPSYYDVINLPKDMVGIVLHVDSGRLTYFDNEHGYLDKDEL